MKKIAIYLVSALSLSAIIFSVAALNKTYAATSAAPQVATATEMTSTPAAQPVDLTYAAEKALPSVVYIMGATVVLDSVRGLARMVKVWVMLSVYCL
ncbi:MAG: hypothetical protein K2J86_08510 [Prevotella sp.]|nr:hypothetical protein [Prevotella sp.]